MDLKVILKTPRGRGSQNF